MADDKKIDVAQVVTYWLTEAEDALRVAHHLIEKLDYSYALFFGHLAIEKLLKAVYTAKLGTHAPPIHNLLRLARKANLPLSEVQSETLITITAFNIEARYPDIKRAFRQKCTPAYTDQQIKLIEELYEWLKSQLK